MNERGRILIPPIPAGNGTREQEQWAIRRQPEGQSPKPGSGSGDTQTSSTANLIGTVAPVGTGPR